MARPRKVKASAESTVRVVRRVAGYIRVSTELQVNEGFSLEAQRRKLEASALAAGYHLVTIYEDAGLSGKSTERPQLAAMLAAADAGTIDGVMVVKLDRLTRSLRDLIAISDQLDRAGVALISMAEAIDTGTPTGRLFRNILGSLAEFERETILDRITTGMVEKARQGKRVGARVPYGYQLAQDGTAAIVEAQAIVVRRIFAERAAGRTIAAIAAGLNTDGIPAPAGGTWVVSRVYGICRNPYYAGRVRFNERSARATITTAAVDHEGIISEATFRRVSGTAAA